eukprot:CAMPEP_0170470640 /NCGR_PEP_ID=MMETSP0123-20130129/13041_1 /TAXON_ID=182087 /ORGANISM="Favella ehrenbergii, Strain Fehren 1" /LENGTH=40 /DNA_ID= /DNA_START= /DNA_END= /DNA_ORIENTATION=
MKTESNKLGLLRGEVSDYMGELPENPEGFFDLLSAELQEL